MCGKRERDEWAKHWQRYHPHDQRRELYKGILSDKTKVGESRWRELKEEAMGYDFWKNFLRGKKTRKYSAFEQKLL